VDVSQDVIVRADDCGTDDGLIVRDLIEGDETMRPDSRSLLNRRLADPVKDPKSGEVLFEAETFINQEVLETIRTTQEDSARIRVHVPTVSLSERLVGRVTCEPVKVPGTRQVLVKAGEMIDRHIAERIEKAGVREAKVRSVLTCKLGKGVCTKCYGLDLAANDNVEIGEAVGIIAAQSIGEPGTQLTMRTFHLGGVASGASLTGVANVKRARQQALAELRSDIDKGNLQMVGTATEQKREIQRYLKVLEATVGGLLRVVELFEARKPKGEAITTDIDGTVVAIVGGGRAEIQEGVQLAGMNLESSRSGVRKVFVHTVVPVSDRDKIVGHQLAFTIASGKKEIATGGQEATDRILDNIEKAGIESVTIQREFPVPYRGNLDVKVGQVIEAGDTLTKGPLWPQDVLAWRGLKGAAEYLVQEVQKVYRAQGISIHDKHIEVIVRQMLRKRRVKDPGETEVMPGKLIDHSTLNDINAKAVEEGRQPATADFVLLGITEAALATESFLSAASFQKTTKVLTEAATHGRVDNLEGLKENVIIGRLIPAGTGLGRKQMVEVGLDPEAVEYAKANADLLNASDLAPRQPEKAAVNLDDLLPVEAQAVGEGALLEGEMADAGMSVNEGGDADLDDLAEVEPTVDDLESVDLDGADDLDGMLGSEFTPDEE
jgi:DNA-directed RNA polymerase subunit beta'